MPPSRTSAAPDRRTAAESVYRALKRDILTLAHRPGARLGEVELAARHGTSRVPVREACRRLQQEGLVTSEPWRGYFAARLTVREIRESFDLRLVLESHAVTLAAARAREEDLARLEDLASAEYVHRDFESYAAFLDRNLEYHLAVAEIGGNALLSRILRDLVEGMQRYFFLGLDLGDFGREMREEHERLNLALRRRSRTGAVKCIREQIESSRRRILDRLLAGGADLPLT
ncbi:MAG: GntR family transcriptional regulator [Planctomycetes bacterium]|jgi:DNA-binding GntR family transcriptional regulator|nr:GntR family transcriptional regulator [Planctomycetota bacterium]